MNKPDTRLYYFWQHGADFFESPDLLSIEEEAGDRRYDYMIIYQKLIDKSLREHGHLKNGPVPYNTTQLRRMIRFQKSTIEEADDYIEGAIKLFKELGLAKSLKNGSLFLTRVPLLVKGKTEAAKDLEERRRRNKIFEREDLPQHEIELETTLQLACDAMVFYGYITPEEIESYEDVLSKLCDTYRSIDIMQATNRLLERHADDGFQQIANRLHYYQATIAKIINEELGGIKKHNIVYFKRFFDFLIHKEYVMQEDHNNYITLYNFLASKYKHPDINEALALLFSQFEANKIDFSKINNRYAYLKKVLDTLLLHIERNKNVQYEFRDFDFKDVFHRFLTSDLKEERSNPK